MITNTNIQSQLPHLHRNIQLGFGSDASVKSTQKCKPKFAQYMDTANIYGKVSLCCLSLHGNCMYSVEDGQEISKGLARPVQSFFLPSQTSKATLDSVYQG